MTAKHKATGGYALKTVEDMQKDIMTNGPIQVAFNVFKSFMSYKSGVYKKKLLELFPEGGHAVKIIGWGTENARTTGSSPTRGTRRGGWTASSRSARQQRVRIEKRGPPYAGMLRSEASSSWVASSSARLKNYPGCSAGSAPSAA